MTRQAEFEGMNWQEWPDDLIELQEATKNAWAAWAALDDMLDGRVRKTRGVFNITRNNLIEMAGRAWALLRDLRAEGMRQLAAWEEGNLVKLAANEIEWEEKEGVDSPHN